MEIIKAVSTFLLYTGEKGKPLYLNFPLKSGKSICLFFILPPALTNEDLIINSDLAYENSEKKSQGER